eukprot:12015418-Alexandrium_andersonii.AAC.1
MRSCAAKGHPPTGGPILASISCTCASGSAEGWASAAGSVSGAGGASSARGATLASRRSSSKARAALQNAGRRSSAPNIRFH